MLVCAGDLRLVTDMQLAFAGKKFSNYNVREFVQRKAKADFRSNAAQTDKAAIEADVDTSKARPGGCKATGVGV